jgi:uncharacterized protein YdaU (DUF1376 family)
MAKFPFLPLNVQALLADTNHLTTEEFGAYCLILFTMWEHGGTLPDNRVELARITRMSPHKFGQHSEKIMRPLSRLGGKVSQKRLTETWLKIQAIKHRRSVAANKRHNANTHASAYANAMQTRCKTAVTKIRKKDSLSYFAESEEEVSPDTTLPEPAEPSQGVGPEPQKIATPELERFMATKLGKG